MISPSYVYISNGSYVDGDNDEDDSFDYDDYNDNDNISNDGYKVAQLVLKVLD